MIGANMIATTLYLPRHLYRQIGLVARNQKKPKAKVIREFLDAGVRKQEVNPLAAKMFVDALRQIKFKGGIRDFAKNHDKYIWG